jgi:ABC-type dipeptide/oligopeptide/nickel transport system permease subunit
MLTVTVSCLVGGLAAGSMSSYGITALICGVIRLWCRGLLQAFPSVFHSLPRCIIVEILSLPLQIPIAYTNRAMHYFNKKEHNASLLAIFD